MQLADLSIIALFEHCKTMPRPEKAVLWPLLRDLRIIAAHEHEVGLPRARIPPARVRALLRSDLALLEATDDHAR